jgi:hypothetical protein
MFYSIIKSSARSPPRISSLLTSPSRATFTSHISFKVSLCAPPGPTTSEICAISDGRLSLAQTLQGLELGVRNGFTHDGTSSNPIVLNDPSTSQAGSPRRNIFSPLLTPPIATRQYPFDSVRGDQHIPGRAHRGFPFFPVLLLPGHGL